MTRGRKLLIAGAAMLVLAAGGVGIAQAVGGDSEEQVTGPQADRAKQAAVDAIGGGRAVGVERGDDSGAAWEVEVVRPDGSEVEVNLTSDLKQVGAAAEDDGGRSESEDEGEAEGD
jgi:opacity protein-like surface antigen